MVYINTLMIQQVLSELHDQNQQQCQSFVQLKPKRYYHLRRITSFGTAVRVSVRFSLTKYWLCSVSLNTMANSEIPENPDEITDSWLTKVLRLRRNLGSATVDGHLIEPIKIEIGDWNLVRLVLRSKERRHVPWLLRSPAKPLGLRMI
jgi:hypothetical protein